MCSRSSSTLVSFRFFTDRVFISCSLIIYTDEKVSQRESIKSKSIRACVMRVILKEKERKRKLSIFEEVEELDGRIYKPTLVIKNT